jgi:tetratricopeptide (TPR) repeat protein
VLVVEDTHWAADAVRAVLQHLLPALEDAPALLVCTARPEIRAMDDGVVGAAWDLAPLDAAATLEVLTAAAGRDLDPEDVSIITERAGGNPLFAIEFGRTIGATDAGAGVPTSIRAVIAARLDTLPDRTRDAALDAAVVGTTCWPGAIAAIDPGRDVGGLLDDLVARGVLAATPSSRLAGEPAFTFTHALIRDEAYGRLPRAGRARRHLDVAIWLEGVAGDAATTFAASLAHHYAQAADAGRASGNDDVLAAAEPPAIRWLVTAAEQVFRLDGEGAMAMFERALAMGATDELAERALYGSAVVGRRIGSLPASEVLDRYRRALASARERGDTQAAGLQLVRVGSQLAAMGASDEALGCYEEAISVLEPLPPGMPLAAALTYRAEEEMFTGHSDASLALVERALPIAREGGFHDLVIMGLHLRGDARCELGDLTGVEDLQEALRIARASSGIAEVATSLAYVGEWRWQLEGPRAGAEVFEEGVTLTRRAGVTSQGMWSTTHLLLVSTELGAWDRSLQLAGELLSLGADMLDASLDVIARVHRSTIMLRRGQAGAVDDPAKVVALAEGSHELQALTPALSFAAQHALAAGDPAAAAAAIERLTELTTDTDAVYRAGEGATIARLAIAMGDVDRAERFVEPLRDLHVMRHRLYTDAARAAIAEAKGVPGAADGYRDVARRWHEYGHPWEEAHALLGLGRTGGDPAATRRAIDLLERLGVPTDTTRGGTTT